jgi:F0F1-type ATP synthase membrane subunit b/b'
MQIELIPDFTIVYQWILFMIAFMALHFCVFRPALHLIDRRRTGTDGAKETADALKIESEKLAAVYEKKLESARLEGIRKKDEIRTSGEKYKEESIKKARAEVERSLEEVRSKIDLESKEATLQLRSKSREMAHEIASKILEREI